MNRKVNLFMRLLYRISLEDQAVPGRLIAFLEDTPGIEYDESNKFAKINLDGMIF